MGTLNIMVTLWEWYRHIDIIQFDPFWYIYISIYIYIYKLWDREPFRRRLGWQVWRRWPRIPWWCNLPGQPCAHFLQNTESRYVRLRENPFFVHMKAKNRLFHDYFHPFFQTLFVSVREFYDHSPRSGSNHLLWKPTYMMFLYIIYPSSNPISPAIGPLEFWEAAALAVPSAGGTGELSGPSGGCNLQGLWRGLGWIWIVICTL